MNSREDFLGSFPGEMSFGSLDPNIFYAPVWDRVRIGLGLY
jgi:hypothetical protein